VAVAFAQTTVTPLPETAPVQAAPLDAAAVDDLANARARAGVRDDDFFVLRHGESRQFD
jgi:hypothetical protein